MVLLLLIWITGYDIRQRRIPLICIGTGSIYWVVRTAVSICNGGFDKKSFWMDLIAACLLVGICMLTRMICRECVGLGDVLLLGIYSLLVGRELMIESMLITFLLFSFCSLCLLGLGYSKKTALPFAPFLLTGYGIVLGIQFLGS